MGLADEFLKEATRLWEVESNRDAVTTISAALLLILSCNNIGKDKDGVVYLDVAAEMAQRLGLLGDALDPSSSLLNLDDNDTRSAAAFAAWGLFGWQT